MNAQPLIDWVLERRTGAAITVIGVVFVLGLIGWWLTAPELGFLSVLYNTLTLFALNFGHEGPIHPLLEVARFGAALVVFYAAIRVGVQVLSRRTPVRRASKMREHLVVLGDTDEVTAIASQYRDAGNEVVAIGEITPANLDQLSRRHVVTVPSSFDQLTIKEQRKILEGAQRAVVVGGRRTSHELADTVRQAAETLPLTVLFDSPHFAQDWAQRGDTALCRLTQLSIALLRQHPPFLETAMVPPPIVIGDGRDAAEIVRRIVTGWQQPGESMIVHCLGRDESWVVDARQSVDDRAILTFTPVVIQPKSICAEVGRLAAEWRIKAREERFTLEGPRVYVSFADLITTLPIANAIANAVEGAAVVGLVDANPAWQASTVVPPGVSLVSRRDLLSDPRTLELDPSKLLIDEILADAARWPAAVPSAFGVLAKEGGQAAFSRQDAHVQQRVKAVAMGAQQVLGAGGVRLEQRAWAAEPTFVLTPDQLSRIERALANDLPGDDAEARLRRFELAARLPILAARAGLTPVLTSKVRTLTPTELRAFALLAHAEYKKVASATDNATQSANALKEWAELAEVNQRSNIAQVADIPVKLACLGLTWREADTPVRHRFTVDQIEQLAENEHRRWAHFENRNGRHDHQWNKTWARLTEIAAENAAQGNSEVDIREYDRNAVRAIPDLLASVGLEIVPMDPVG